MRTPPPKKKAGVKTGRRKFDGELLDVTAAAALLGTSEKAIRARVARHLVPYRRDNGRIVLIRRELLEFLAALPGVSVEQALANVATRDGRREPAA